MNNQYRCSSTGKKL